MKLGYVCPTVYIPRTLIITRALTLSHSIADIILVQFIKKRHYVSLHTFGPSVRRGILTIKIYGSFQLFTRYHANCSFFLITYRRTARVIYEILRNKDILYIQYIVSPPMLSRISYGANNRAHKICLTRASVIVPVNEMQPIQTERYFPCFGGLKIRVFWKCALTRSTIEKLCRERKV